MIDLHTHTIFSDGQLIPSELVRRAEALGLKGVALTDHGDASNIDFIVPRIASAAKDLRGAVGIRVIPGIEITHAPPSQIGRLAESARKLGAEIVVVHGETIVEPVAPGTNAAALEADIDILAHPGFILESEAYRAGEKGILLEITSRRGHSLTNGHVARMAKKTGAGMVINTDAHSPGDLIDAAFALAVARGAGLTEEDYDQMQQNAYRFLP
jgi:histidinol phosphatase-like PHP family hydrolase